MNDVRHTARLVLRPFRADDVPPLYAIQGNRVDMRFTWVAPSLDECAARLQAHEDSRARFGFAPWVAVDRSEGGVVGWGGLAVDPGDPGWGPEVVYFFDSAHWGRGLATELVQAAMRHAFEDLSLSQVSAFAMPDNLASIRVLQKCGFDFLRYEDALERNHYLISAPAEDVSRPPDELRHRPAR